MLTFTLHKNFGHETMRRAQLNISHTKNGKMHICPGPWVWPGRVTIYEYSARESVPTGDLERTQKLHYNTTYESSCRNSCLYRHAIYPQSLCEKYGVVKRELAGREMETRDKREGPSSRAAQLNLNP